MSDIVENALTTHVCPVCLGSGKQHIADVAWAGGIFECFGCGGSGIERVPEPTPDYAAMQFDAMKEACGADPSKWAHALMQCDSRDGTNNRHGYLYWWLANAMGAALKAGKVGP